MNVPTNWDKIPITKRNKKIRTLGLDKIHTAWYNYFNKKTIHFNTPPKEIKDVY